jgi:UDP-N-acetylmuramate: L-alanyl-gamma-D-glutamyl-meso-diaminopimelate ligase
MRIHFIAIGGSIMHSLAIAMKKAGHEVSGSDDEIYEPSRSRLAALGILPESNGWHAERITPEIDIVVLGMHARKDNPELLEAQRLNLRMESFPEFMYRISMDKTRIVVTGSHGKTTTTGMIAHILDRCQVPADRMIGASIGDLEPVVISEAGIIVLEGDEYLSSPLDSRPKFLHYHPDITIITGIAWDHMNVFPTYDSYKAPFRQLIQSLTPANTLIYCADDDELVKLVQEIAPVCTCVPYNAMSYTLMDEQVIVKASSGKEFPMQIFGKHNMQNLSAALLACQKLGLDEENILKAMQSFAGANKRLQLLFKNDLVTMYTDFAHAPSKVKATVEAVREKHPNAKIVACLELHTFSSLNPGFLPLYADALKDADDKIVYFSPHTLASKRLPDLSADQLAVHFNAPDLIVVQSGDELKEVVESLKVGSPLVMLWMSSGRFDGVDIANLKAGVK